MDFLDNSILNNKLFNVFQVGGAFGEKEIIKKICIFVVFILLILEISQPLSKVPENFKSGTPMALAVTTSFVALAMLILLGISMFKPGKAITVALVISIIAFYTLLLTMTILGKPDLSKSGQAYLYTKLVLYFGLFVGLIASMLVKANREGEL
jgi:FtsH-binding integral membrane protein